MTTSIKQLKDQTTARLLSYFDGLEAEAIARTLLQEVWGRSYPMLVVDPPKDTEICVGISRLEGLVERLLQHEPLQYVIGRVPFDDLTIEVAPGVLIPRPETEELCALICKTVQQRMGATTIPRQVADLCTGSGCIALHLATHCEYARVEAVEWSSDACAVAERNFVGLEQRITLRHCDLLAPDYTPLFDSYEVVASNPPYIHPKERVEMRPHVLEHEPEMALFAPSSDPLVFYRVILQHYASRLTPKGFIAWEINPYYAHDLEILTHDYGLTPEIHLDSYGRKRFMLIYPN